ncbi:Lipase (class 3) [Seminavis robusta]|uniref:sn-1-specific diacylglycerol lipase n=1 Tax=Seminavis robusta TaxID=568900 RepID=A0A9N8ES73_9STRA|nr:Lipase (class 3) [Seminavis robusta]|eukprot:Sro1629_g287140.1 Lipase (class 3) (291) ;mRNA; f:20018-21013
MVVSHLTAGGSMDVLRHYVVVDHSRKALVFAIRGTFSISGVICDWVSFSAPFCGGLGHVAMSEVAKKMWDLTKNDVLAKLQELPDDYDLVVTGHSLGAGVATLLTILLYHEKCIPNNKIRCFAFAPPPTYHPLSAAPEAVAATTAYIHGDDTVPFLSVYHLRRFFRSMAALKTATKGMSTWDFLRIDWGYDEPSQEMVEAMRKAEAQDLRAVKGSEKLAIPAQAVVWMQKGSSTEHPDAFHASICDARKLSELPIRVPTSQRHMLEHHLASKYEIALQGVQQQPEKDKEQ